MREAREPVVASSDLKTGVNDGNGFI